MRLRSWLWLAVLAASGGLATAQAQEHPVEPAGTAAAAAPAAAHESHEPTPSEIFLGLFMHLQPHPVTAVWWGGSKGFGLVAPYETDARGQPLELDAHDQPVTFASRAELVDYYRAAFGGGNGLLIYNINTAQWIAAVLVLVVFVGLARAARRRGDGPPTGVIYNLLESIVLFIRDDMVYSVLGAEVGRRYAPLFLTQFFFILFMNLLGLLWLPGGVGGTATANLAVTGGLALTTLLWINLAGMREHGFFGYWKIYKPHGLPLFVLPLIVLIELASTLIVKPLALTIRLFANLTAGHLVLMSLFALVYVAGSFAVGVPALLAFGMAVAISAFEIFVAFVQAYIFTYLSIIFVGASVHPEH